MRDDDRGTGRTTEQIVKMRAGDIFVVDNLPMFHYAKKIADEQSKNIRVIVNPGDPYRLRGLPRHAMIVVDHACSPGEATRQVIFEHNSRVPEKDPIMRAIDIG